MSPRFVVVGTQRTGSSALALALAEHPDVFAGWEWMLDIYPWKKLAVAERALCGDSSVLQAPDREHIAKDFRGQSVFGFRWLFRSSGKWILHPGLAPALVIDRLEAFLKWARKKESLRIVHVVRNDNLAWLQSKELSRASGLFIDKAYPDGLQVQVDVNDAVRRILAKNWVDSRLGSLKETGRYCLVRYEDFAADNNRVARDVLTFLGCDTSATDLIAPPISRQNKRPPSHVVSNFDHVVAVLTNRNLLTSQF